MKVIYKLVTSVITGG